MFPITNKRQMSPCHDGYLYLPVAILSLLYLVYLVECVHCPLWTQVSVLKVINHFLLGVFWLSNRLTTGLTFLLVIDYNNINL